MLRILALASASALVALSPAMAAPPAAKPQIGAFGFDEAGMDRAAKPGDSFYAFANGTWEKTAQIPADRAVWGGFAALDELSTQRSHEILEAAAKTPGSKIGDLYASFMDEAAADAAGVRPLQPTLDAIKAADTPGALAREMGALLKAGVNVPFRFGVGQDDKNPDQYIVGFSQGGLGLPDRDYYLKPDKAMADVRVAYEAYLARLLTLAGEADPASRAKAIVAFETTLAQAHWTRIDSRDAEKTYNVWTRADFDARAPGFDWAAYLAASGAEGQGRVLVAQPSAYSDMAKAVAATPPPVLKDYLLVRTLNSYAPFLSKPFVDASFGFNQTTLSGTPQNAERWKRGTNLVKGLMGEALGQDYVAKYFTPQAKAAADALVKNIIAAMDARLARIEWMAPETRAKARAKLAAFSPKIGYPARWRDYSALEIRRGDLVGDVMRGRAFEFQRDLNKLGHPIDREEWSMTPMEVNAYADFGLNQIVFPAAILQPPFFDPAADPAVNYGGIGSVIGHEMSHHFDDQGSKYDAHGRLTDWWTPQDLTGFKAKTEALVKQYDAYEPVPGIHVQGALTLGENIADLAGLTVAHDAYALSLNGRPAPVLDGFTGDQRFYLGFAQVWRWKYREANLRQRLVTDPHSPSPERVATVRNLDPWYAAFKPKPGDKLYLAPDQRIRIW